MLTKGSSARIHVTLRNPATGSARKAEIPLETFATNKSMGRVLFRRGGTTIGSLLVCFSFAELSRADPRLARSSLLQLLGSFWRSCRRLTKRCFCLALRVCPPVMGNQSKAKVRRENVRGRNHRLRS